MNKLPLLISLFAIGCKTVNKDYGMVSSSDLVTEPHKVWTRPLEVGFELGEYIEAESSTSRFMGMMRVSGDPVKDAARVPMLGETSKLSSNGEYAVAKAVQKANADGMYILYVEETDVWAGLVVKKSTKVRGRALKLEDFGSVDVDRATQIRIEESKNTKKFR